MGNTIGLAMGKVEGHDRLAVDCELQINQIILLPLEVFWGVGEFHTLSQC